MRGNDGHQCLTELIIAIWKMFSFSFSFQWCFFFFLQLRLQGNGRPRATLCMLRIVVFFFHGSESNERTKFSELGPRRYVNDVSFRFQWVFFQLGLRGNGRLQATLCSLWFLVVFSHGSIDQINRGRMISGRTFTKR